MAVGRRGIAAVLLWLGVPSVGGFGLLLAAGELPVAAVQVGGQPVVAADPPSNTCKSAASSTDRSRATNECVRCATGTQRQGAPTQPWAWALILLSCPGQVLWDNQIYQKSDQFRWHYVWLKCGHGGHSAVSKREGQKRAAQ